MKKYIGSKLIEAKTMYRGDYNEYRGWSLPESENAADEGYLIKYPDGYESWLPKEIFEKVYLKVDDNKELPSGVSIGPKMVQDFISWTETYTIGACTTVVYCVLRNGFTITESSACVDPKNYDQKIGEQICMERIESKIWELLGFLLQTAWHGIQ